MPTPHNFAKGDYVREVKVRKNKAGIKAKTETARIYRAVNVFGKSDDALLLTDGYYFFVGYLGYNWQDEWEKFDPLAGALLEKEHGAMRPRKDRQKWTINIKREAKTENNVAIDSLRVWSLTPGDLLPITVHYKDMWPAEVLDQIGANRDGTFSYASAHALTLARPNVKWKAGSTSMRGVLYMPDFKMRAESLK